MPDNSKHPIIQELIRRLIQSDPAHAPEIRSPFAKGGPGRKGGSDPHVGLDVVLPDQGEVSGCHALFRAFKQVPEIYNSQCRSRPWC